MRKKVVLLAIASLAFLGISCGRFTNQETTKSTASDNIPLSVSDGSELGAGVVELTSPEEDAVLSSPFLVSGRGEFTDGRAYVRVKNKAGQSVIEAWTAAKGDDGKFSVLITFNFKGTTEGMVEVFGKDSSGAEVGLVSVPVKFDVTSSEDVEVVPE